MVSEFDDNVDGGFTKVSDSERYQKMQNNYQFLQARAKTSYNGGAVGDLADRAYHKQGQRLKNYRNYEKAFSNSIKESYRKIFQDADITKFLNRFPELRSRKEEFGAESTIVMQGSQSFSPWSKQNPFRNDAESYQKIKRAQ